MSTKKDKPTPPKITDIYLPKELDPLYSNLVNMSLSKNELVLDFIIVGPGGSSDVKIISRIYMSRAHAEEFSKKLAELLNKK